MKKTTIKAVEMVRRIRDAHYEQLRGKSPKNGSPSIATSHVSWRPKLLRNAKNNQPTSSSPPDERSPHWQAVHPVWSWGVRQFSTVRRHGRHGSRFGAR